jgi:hypothetical protein
MAQKVTACHPIDLITSLTGDLHAVLRDAAQRGPLATDTLTGATVVLRQQDVEALSHVRGCAVSGCSCST